MPSPTSAIRMPANEGPKIRALFTMEEFKAIALERSSLFSTISITKRAQKTSVQNTISSWDKLYKISSVAALLQLAVIVVYFFVIAILGGTPTRVEEYLTLLQNTPLVGILRGDLFNLLIVALYLGLTPGLYLALRRVHPVGAAFSSLLILIAVILCFGSNSDFSMLHLSGRYTSAATEAQRSQIVAAGEAILATNMWNSSGAYVSGLFLQGAGVLISITMLRSKDFSKVTAIAGLLGNGLDLVQHILHPFQPSIFALVLRAAGPFYLIWFPMLARDFLQLVKSTLNGSEG